MLRLSHVRLLTNQFPVMFRFYRDAMDVRVRWGDEHGVYADFDTGTGVDIALYSRSAIADMIGTDHLPSAVAAQDRVMLIVAVESVDDTALTLRKRGAEMVSAPEDRAAHGIRTAHFRDPDGNLIEINSPLAESAWSDDLRRLNRTVNWDTNPDQGL